MLHRKRQPRHRAHFERRTSTPPRPPATASRSGSGRPPPRASQYTVADGWRCRNVAATSWSTGPSTARRTIAALCSPVARRQISRASRIVATPIVIAWRGTFSSPKKSAAASRRVTVSSVISRVRDSAPDPGSLKPMCPVLPMPSNCRSIPPAARIAASYAAHAAATSVRRDVARREVGARRVEVDQVEEVLAHEPVVAVDRLRRHRPVLVEIERLDAGERQSFVAVHAHQLAVHADRRRSGGKPEYAAAPFRGSATDRRRDPVRHRACQLVGRGEDFDRQVFAATGVTHGGAGSLGGCPESKRHRLVRSGAAGQGRGASVRVEVDRHRSGRERRERCHSVVGVVR